DNRCQPSFNHWLARRLYCVGWLVVALAGWLGCWHRLASSGLLAGVAARLHGIVVFTGRAGCLALACQVFTGLICVLRLACLLASLRWLARYVGCVHLLLSGLNRRKC